MKSVQSLADAAIKIIGSHNITEAEIVVVSLYPETGTCVVNVVQACALRLEETVKFLYGASYPNGWRHVKAKVDDVEIVAMINETEHSVNREAAICTTQPFQNSIDGIQAAGTTRTKV